MENGQPKNLLQLLTEVKESLAETEVLLEEAKISNPEKVSEVQKKYEAYKKLFSEFKNSYMLVDLEKIVVECAKENEISVEDLDVIVYFPTAKRNKKFSGKDKFIKHINKTSCEIDVITMLVYVYTKSGEFKLMIPTRMFLEDIQKDGKTLRDTLDVETTRNGLKYSTNFVCTDYKNLILRLPFANIFDVTSCEPINSAAEMIYRVYERDQQKNLENGETV